MEAASGLFLLAEVRRYLIEEAPPIARKRLLDAWTAEQGLSWSYRQASTWLADCLNADRRHRLPLEIAPHLVVSIGHTRWLDALFALETAMQREARLGPMRVRPERERRRTA